MLLYRKHTHFFMAGLIEELPTVLLAWARLAHAKELHWPFALLYFIVRILYHVVATFEVLEHSLFAFGLGLVIFRQHLWWLGAWWRRSSASARRAPRARRATCSATGSASPLWNHKHMGGRQDWPHGKWWQWPTKAAKDSEVIGRRATCCGALQKYASA